MKYEAGTEVCRLVVHRRRQLGSGSQVFGLSGSKANYCSYCQLSFACCTGQPNLQTSVIHTGVSGSLYSIPSVNVNTGYAIHWWSAVVAIETSSFPPFTTTGPSQYVQAYNYLMAISLNH